jgi:hypothetical protein
MAHGDAREGSWRGNWRMQWVASTLHTTSEHGVSSITNVDAHTSAASSRVNWRPRRFKWTRPFRRKTKSDFCVCVITFQTQSNTASWPKGCSTDGQTDWLTEQHCNGGIDNPVNRSSPKPCGMYSIDVTHNSLYLVDIHISVLLQIYSLGTTNKMSFFQFIYFNNTVHVSVGTSTHHLELGLFIQLLVFVKPCCYLLRSWLAWNAVPSQPWLQQVAARFDKYQKLYVQSELLMMGGGSTRNM